MCGAASSSGADSGPSAPALLPASAQVEQTPETAGGALLARIVYKGVGDGCSIREDERMRSAYAFAVNSLGGRRYCDPEFEPSNESLGSGAEVYCNFTGGMGKVGCPVVWRRPIDIADENGVFQPGSNVHPESELRALARNAPASRSSLPGVFSPPIRTHIEFLAEQASRNPAGGGGPRGGEAWVFRRGPYSGSDVVQGQLGTCWFVSALSLVAGRESLVSFLFAADPLKDALLSIGRAATEENLVRGYVPLNPSGIYVVRLCIDGLWRWITVDDRIPCNAFKGSPAYSCAQNRQLWVPLLEKAAAKCVGSYAGFASGTVAEGLRLLTGAPVLSLNLLTNETDSAAGARHARERSGDFSALASGGDGVGGGTWGEWCVGTPNVSLLEPLWVRLTSWWSAGYLLGASCGPPSTSNFPPAVSRAFSGNASAWERVCAAADAAAQGKGLQTNHAYSLLSFYQCPHSEVRLVQVRNPHGRVSKGSSSWSGDWCDGHSLWGRAHASLVSACDPTRQSSTGTFWMSLGDLVRYFHRVDVARVRENRREAGGAAEVEGKGGNEGLGRGGASSLPPPPIPRILGPDSRGGGPRKWSCLRTRLPLPSAENGVYILKLTPSSNINVDCAITDVTSQMLLDGTLLLGSSAAGGSGSARYRRKGGGETPKRDLAILAVEGLTRLEVVRMGEKGSGGVSVSGNTAPPLPPPPQQQQDSFSDGDEWNSSSVGPSRAALAATATSMALVAGPPRSMTQCAGLQFWMKAGRAYSLFPLSLGGWKAEGGLSGAVVLEIHYPGTPQGEDFSVEVQRVSTGFFSRALLCRTLSLGKELVWRGDALRHAMSVSHDDGAGAIIAAANTHPTQSFELCTGVTGVAGQSTACVVLGREGRCVDGIPPLHAQLIQTVSPAPGVENWGYGSTFSVTCPGPPFISHSPPIPANSLFSALPLAS